MSYISIVNHIKHLMKHKQFYLFKYGDLQSREKAHQIMLQMISNDGQTLYRSVMLHDLNPIKGLYFDMSTKSYAE